MPDEKIEEKKEEKVEEKAKQTVPALMRTFKGIADHAQAVQDRQWDKERKVLRDPLVVSLALFSYIKLLATLSNEAEERFAKDKAAFEKRIAEFETRLTTVERWRAEAEAQTAEMTKGLEDMMAGGPEALVTKLKEMLPPNGNGKIIDAETVPATNGNAESAIVPLKQPEKKREEKGNAS